MLINHGCCRYQSPVFILFDGKFAKVLTSYDNETEYMESSRIDKLPYPQHSDSPMRFRNFSSCPPMHTSFAQTSRTSPSRTQPLKTTSWCHAIEQINALFDLALCTDMDGMIIQPTISTDVVLTALESFVGRIRILVQEGEMKDMESLLPAIDVLLCRVNELHTTPTLSTVESVWWILQHEWRRSLPTGNTVENSETPFRRTIHLLRNWTTWSHQVGTPLYKRPPPLQLVMQLFQIGTSTMSTDLWRSSSLPEDRRSLFFSIPSSSVCRNWVLNREIQP